ncbi:MAG: hypothetical protein U0166_00690 [Acidobacteriota bacterium]
MKDVKRGLVSAIKARARQGVTPERRRDAAAAMIAWYAATFGARRAQRYLGAQATLLGVALPATERPRPSALGGAWVVGLIMGLCLGVALGLAGGSATNAARATNGKAMVWPPELVAMQEEVRKHVEARRGGLEAPGGGPPAGRGGASPAGTGREGAPGTRAPVGGGTEAGP